MYIFATGSPSFFNSKFLPPYVKTCTLADIMDARVFEYIFKPYYKFQNHQIGSISCDFFILIYKKKIIKSASRFQRNIALLHLAGFKVEACVGLILIYEKLDNLCHISLVGLTCGAN